MDISVRSTLQRFFGLLKQFKSEFRLIYTYAIFYGIVNLSLPLGIQAIINFLQAGEFSSSWLILVMIVILGTFAAGYFQILQMRILENIQQEIFARSAFEFAYRIPFIKCIYDSKLKGLNITNKFFDTLTIQKNLPKVLIDLSLAIFQIVFGIILLGIYSSYFIIIGILLFSVLWMIIRFTGKPGFMTSMHESTSKYKLVFWLQNIATFHKGFKVRSSSNFHITKADELTHQYLKNRESHFQKLLTQFRYFIGFRVLTISSLLLLGGILVFNNELNIGQFVAAEIVIILIVNSVEKILSLLETIFDMLTSLEKLGSVFDLDMFEDEGYIDLKTDRLLELKFHDVNFKYGGQSKMLFKQLDLTLIPQSKNLITGNSGTGKSTLAGLISGILKPHSGEILVNDIPIQNIKRHTYYNQLGVVFGDHQIFDGTVYQNITLGRAYSEEYLTEIIKALCIEPYLRDYPKRLDTPIQMGGDFPMNMIKKIELARAILHKPKLLILDEALEFINVEEQKHIIKYLTDDKHKWTLLVISNNPAWKEANCKLYDMKSLNHA